MGKPAFIWDLDGTLLNSYDVIASSLHEALLECGVDVPQAEIHKRSIQGSVGDFLQRLYDDVPFDMDRVTVRNKEISRAKVFDITTMPGAHETLRELSKLGCINMVYTHKGVTTEKILAHLELLPYFTEVVCSLNGFPRKPAPDAVTYLVEKYALNPKMTFYVGDRAIDIHCAANAGIEGILYLPEGSYAEPTGREKHVIHDLPEAVPIAKLLI